MKKTELFFPIEPKPKGRPRFNFRTGTAYTPKETKDTSTEEKNDINSDL